MAATPFSTGAGRRRLAGGDRTHGLPTRNPEDPQAHAVDLRPKRRFRLIGKDVEMTHSRQSVALRAGNWLVFALMFVSCIVSLLFADWQVTFPDGSESTHRSWWWEPPMGETASEVGIQQRILAWRSVLLYAPFAALVVSWRIAAWRRSRLAAERRRPWAGSHG